MIKGFRDFILRGNVIDLAVAVVVGAAFTALVAAVTANLIQPVLNAFGGVDTCQTFNTKCVDSEIGHRAD